MSIASVASIRSHFQFNLRINAPNHQPTTPLPTPRLLALPREIRDKIYTYLSQTITFDWKWRVTGRKRAIFTVHIPLAPRLNLLLVCSCFYAEMLEILGKCVIINWTGRLHKHVNSDAKNAKSRLLHKKYREPFKRATNVVVLTRNVDWGIVDRFCGKVREYMPRVAAVSVCEHTWVAGRRSCYYVWMQHEEGIRSEHMPARLLELRGDRDCAERAPAQLSGLRFMRFGRTVRIGTEVLWDLRTSPQGYGRNYDPSAIMHKVEKMDVYSFTGQDQRACLDQRDMDVLWSFWPFIEVRSEVILPKHDEESIERFRIPTWDQWRIDEVTNEENHSVEEEGFARWFE